MQMEMIKTVGEVIKFSYDLELINKNANLNPKKLINFTERFYKTQIDEVVEEVLKGDYKFVFVSGASSAGKTTSSIKIKKALAKYKIKSRVISMDDFFLGFAKSPKLPDGSPDFESVHAIDIPCFTKFIKDIMEKNSADLPYFDFPTSKRTKMRRIKIEKNEILIVEGLHAFNPIFNKKFNINKIYKIFVSVSSNFTVGKNVIITSKQLRLMRRMLRDYYNRGDNVNDTVESWSKVCTGEDRYITPYITSANYILNTTHMYEPLLYDKYLEPLLKSANKNPLTEELIKIFQKTGRIDKELVPKSSLIWEFLPNFKNL